MWNTAGRTGRCFFLAEYINTFAIAALTTLLFFWAAGAGPGLPDVAWFLLKTYAVVLVVFWVRGTFPRLRIDQLMAFAWKVMVPLSFYTVVIAAVYRFYGWPWWSLTLLSAAGLAVSGWIIYRRMTAPAAAGGAGAAGGWRRASGGPAPAKARGNAVAVAGCCWYHKGGFKGQGGRNDYQNAQNHGCRI